MTVPTKVFSMKQEKAISDYLGWKTVSGSGARQVPGDVISDSWLGECKTHTSPNHDIEFKMNVWEKLSKEAFSQFKSPVYFTDDGSQILSMTWAMIKDNVSHDYLDVLYPVRKFNKSIRFNHDDFNFEIMNREFKIDKIPCFRVDSHFDDSYYKFLLFRLDDFHEFLEVV